MPELVRLYIRNVVFGALLSVVFVGLLLWLNIANLRHLILGSDIGYIAVALLFVFNTVVFAGVQFAISVMRMAEENQPPGGGKRQGLGPVSADAGLVVVPVPVRKAGRLGRLFDRTVGPNRH